MVTVVPKKAFDALNKKVSEDSEKKSKFDYEDFKKEVLHYSMVKSYLKDKMIEFVGAGSGRTAYMIPKGGCVGHEDSAVCLKVANNVKGIAQNRGEMQVIEKYGRDEPCFPELFGTDAKENISLLCEIGRRVEKKEFYDYFADWDEFSDEAFSKETSEIFGEISTGDDVFHAMRMLKKIKRTGNAGKEQVKKVLSDVKKISSKFKKYVPFVSIFEVLFEKDAMYDIMPGDFAEYDNWAFINRDGKDVLVPIDWGLTIEVANQYYM